MKTLILAILGLLTVLVMGKRIEPNCPEVCPAVALPVCGSKCSCSCETFLNTCELNRHNCEHPKRAYNFVKDGTCPKKCNFFSYHKKDYDDYKV